MEAFKIGNDIVIMMADNTGLSWFSYVKVDNNTVRYRAGSAEVHNDVTLLKIRTCKDIPLDDRLSSFRLAHSMSDYWSETDSYELEGVLYSITGQFHSKPALIN